MCVAAYVWDPADEGVQISLSEIYKLVPRIVSKFDLVLDRPEKEWKTENFWFNKQTGIVVRVARRQN